MFVIVLAISVRGEGVGVRGEGVGFRGEVVGVRGEVVVVIFLVTAFVIVGLLFVIVGIFFVTSLVIGGIIIFLVPFFVIFVIFFVIFLVTFVVIFGIFFVTSFVMGIVSETVSSRCGDALASVSAPGCCNVAFARSATVSVQAQKFGGDDTHPIGFVRGIPTRGGSPGRVGRRTASLIVSSGLIQRR